MSKIFFAAIPYVSIQEDISFGDFVLWKNSSENWERRVGEDRAYFLKIFKDRKGDAINHDVTILSHKEPCKDFSHLWMPIIVSLSTFDWLINKSGGISVDKWMHFPFTLDVSSKKSDGGFVHYGKFSRNFTSADKAAIHPTPFIFSSSLSPNINRDLFKTIESFFTQEPIGASLIIRALSHFHLARYDSPFASFPFQDIERIWSGLEALYTIGISTSGMKPREERLEEAMLNDIESTTGFSLSSSFRAGLKEWIKLAYGEVRCNFTHGDTVNPRSLILHDYNRSVFSVGLTLVYNLIRLRVWKDNILFHMDILRELESLFLSKMLVDSFISFVKNKDRSFFYDKNSTSHNVMEELDTFSNMLGSIIACKSFENIDREGDRKLEQVLSNMVVILCSFLKNMVEKGETLEEPMFELYNKIDKDIKEIQNVCKGKEAEKELVSKAQSYMKPLYPYSHLTMRGNIDVYRWLEAWQILNDIYRGYYRV